MKKRPGPSAIHLMAGGRGQSRAKGDPLLSRIMASAPVAHPAVAYIGAASNDDRSFFSMIEYSMLACGAGRVTLASLVSPHIKVERARETLKSADMVFVSGGDVEGGMEVLEDREVLPLLRELHQAGKPFFGISAGSIMLGRQWVRWEDPDDDSTASLFPCMGLAPLVCDTHSEGEGWGELATLLRLSPEGTVGYGLPSGSGLCVHPDGRVEAMEGPVHSFARKGAKVARLPDLTPPSP
jgi:cyanophycinase